MTLKNTIPVLLVGAWLLVSCGDKGTAQADGDVTETGNAFIRGKMVNTQGEAIDSAEVQLFTSAYNPLSDEPMPDHYIDTTDGQGYYEFTKVDSGAYHIQGVSLVTGERILIKDVQVTENETLVVATDTLLEPGIIDLVIDYYLRKELAEGHVYLPGTAISYPVERDPHIIMGPVPVGITTIRYTRGNLLDALLADTVRVRSGQVTPVYVKDKGPNWPHKN
jgi:hypothetical protein